jgi:hypothetical protein
MMTRYEINEADSWDVSEYLERIEALKRRMSELDQDLREMFSLHDSLRKALLQNSTQWGRAVLKDANLIH